MFVCLFPFFVCLLFYCIGILDASNRAAVIEKPRANAASIPSEQLLPVQEVSEEKQGGFSLFIYNSIICLWIHYESKMSWALPFDTKKIILGWKLGSKFWQKLNLVETLFSLMEKGM